MGKRCCKTVNPFISFNSFNQGFNKIRPRLGDDSSLLLDQFPNAAGAYSLRKLRNGYSGFCIEIQRTSDNATLDVGFEVTADATGNFPVDRSAIETFSVGTNSFIRTWYDQSGNADNIIQTTQANQPQITINGVIITDNTFPTASFDGINDYLSGGSQANPTYISSFAAYSTTDPTTEQVVFQLLPNFSNAKDRGVAFGFARNGANQLGTRALNDAGAPGDDGDAFTKTTQTIVSHIGDITTPGSVTRIDGVAATQAYGARYQLNAAAIDEVVVGSWVAANTHFLNGKISELIFYYSDQTANVSDIENNQSAYYNQSTWDVDYIAVYDAFQVKPSSADGEIQNTLVVDWKADGYWAKEDIIPNQAIHTGGIDSMRDWKDPTNAAKFGTLVNAPVHQVYAGYTFNGINQYIDSNFNGVTDGVNYTLNDCEYSYYARTQMGPANRMNIGADANPPFISVMRYWGDNNWYSAINAGSQAFRAGSLAITDGDISVERQVNANYDDYRNGNLDLNTAVSAIGIPNLNVYVGADNFNTVASFFSTAQISRYGFGGSLGAVIQAAKYASWQKYLTNYGTQV